MDDISKCYKKRKFNYEDEEENRDSSTSSSDASTTGLFKSCTSTIHPILLESNNVLSIDITDSINSYEPTNSLASSIPTSAADLYKLCEYVKETTTFTNNSPISTSLTKMEILFKKTWKNIIIRNNIFYYLKVLYFKPPKGEIEKIKSNIFHQPVDLLKDSIDKNATMVIFKQRIDNIINYIFSIKITVLILEQFNQVLSDGWLPIFLKKLSLGDTFQQNINRGDLPRTLIELILSKSYNGDIEEGAIPSKVKSLDFDFLSNKNIKIFNENSSVPKYATSLKFDDYFDQKFKVNSLPKNIRKVEFGRNFKFYLDDFKIEPSVHTLKFNNIYSKPIPKHIKNVELGGIGQILPETLFPLSVESIKISNLWKDVRVKNNYFNKLENLKYLEFGSGSTWDFNQINNLPSGLRKLTIPIFNGTISPTSFPPTLTFLSMPKFNRDIKVNDIPSSLVELHLYSFNSKIEKNSINSTTGKGCFAETL